MGDAVEVAVAVSLAVADAVLLVEPEPLGLPEHVLVAVAVPVGELVGEPL